MVLQQQQQQQQRMVLQKQQQQQQRMVLQKQQQQQPRQPLAWSEAPCWSPGEKRARSSFSLQSWLLAALYLHSRVGPVAARGLSDGGACCAPTCLNVIATCVHAGYSQWRCWRCIS